MNIHYFRDGYCHRARCRNINSACFAQRRAERKGGADIISLYSRPSRELPQS